MSDGAGSNRSTNSAGDMLTGFAIIFAVVYFVLLVVKGAMQ